MELFGVEFWERLGDIIIDGIAKAIPIFIGLGWLYYTQKRQAQEVKEAVQEHTKKLEVVKEDVHKIELATNSMKDELVRVTEKEGVARGKSEERERADAEKQQKNPQDESR